MHARWRPRSTACSMRLQRSSERARGWRSASRPRWPMIVLRSPTGWTGPKMVDGVPVEGTWRAHQVPLAEVSTNPAHRRMLEEWMRSYRPEELFDANGAPIGILLELAPAGERRMGSNPHANGGRHAPPLRLPAVADYAVAVARPGKSTAEATRILGQWLRDVLRQPARNFRLFGPDETDSNCLDGVFQVHRPGLGRGAARGRRSPGEDGRVMEVLSEHQCQGWLEGYLLTGRHGLFSCSEAFIHIVDSMFNQHAKWLEASCGYPGGRRSRLSISCSRPRLVSGPQRFLAPGPGLHRPGGRRRRASSACICRPTRTGCCGWPTTVCAVATASTSSWPARTASRSGWQWTRRSAL